MPDFYAHLTMGALTASGLPDALAKKICTEGFVCGLYGPDPLFFYHMPFKSCVSSEGHSLHAEHPAVVLEHLRKAVETELPESKAYACGCLCHYLLDASCHPYVYSWSDSKTLEHTRIEAGFDSWLAGQFPRVQPSSLFRCGLFPDSRIVSEAAAAAYEQVSPEQYVSALASFRSFCRSVFRIYGIKLYDRPGTSDTAVPKRSLHFTESQQKQYEILFSCLQKAAEQAVRQIELLLNCYESGRPIDFLPAVNYKGKALSE